jgi:hypothetical protein
MLVAMGVVFAACGEKAGGTPSDTESAPESVPGVTASAGCSRTPSRLQTASPRGQCFEPFAGRTFR